MGKFRIRQEEPPNNWGKPSRRETLEMMALLKATANQWFVLKEYPGTRHGQVNAGGCAARWNRVYKLQGFKFVSRTVLDGGAKVFRVYGRYVGK